MLISSSSYNRRIVAAGGVQAGRGHLSASSENLGWVSSSSAAGVARQRVAPWRRPSEVDRCSVACHGLLTGRALHSAHQHRGCWRSPPPVPPRRPLARSNPSTPLFHFAYCLQTTCESAARRTASRGLSSRRAGPAAITHMYRPSA
jgi:hypothetical protein